MKIGLETESYHLLFQNGRMDIFGFIKRTAELGLDGVMINIIKDKNLDPNWGTLGSDEPKHLEKVREEIRKHGFFAEIDTKTAAPQHLAKVIEVAHKIGADVIRTYICLGVYNEKLLLEAPENIKKIVPLLTKYRIKLAVENHEEETSDDVIDIIKKVNSPWVGAHCDIGNSMMAWEEPVEAVRKLAPYAFTTHFKDHIVIKEDGDYMVCGVPAGTGNINTEECFKILVEESTLTRINVEMCYPYVTPFKRKPGTGGVQQVGEGAFKVEPFPFEHSIIKPKDYYYPEGDLLELMIKAQEKGVEQSVTYAFALRDKYCR